MTHPSVALALQVTNHLGDVVLDHAGELGLVADAANPARKLRVPDKSVASHHFIILSRVVGEVVGAGEREAALRWLGGIPFLLACQTPRSQDQTGTPTMLFSGVT